MRLLLAALLGLLAYGYHAVNTGDLDGSAWRVKVKRSALLPLSHKTTLAFDHGRFTSAKHLAKGYLPSGYSAQKTGEASRWEASLTREDGTVMDWTGVVRGDKMKGTLIVTRPNGKAKTYSFRGRRKG